MCVRRVCVTRCSHTPPPQLHDTRTNSFKPNTPQRYTPPARQVAGEVQVNQLVQQWLGRTQETMGQVHRTPNSHAAHLDVARGALAGPCVRRCWRRSATAAAACGGAPFHAGWGCEGALSLTPTPRPAASSTCGGAASRKHAGHVGSGRMPVQSQGSLAHPLPKHTLSRACPCAQGMHAHTRAPALSHACAHTLAPPAPLRRASYGEPAPADLGYTFSDNGTSCRCRGARLPSLTACRPVWGHAAVVLLAVSLLA